MQNVPEAHLKQLMNFLDEGMDSFFDTYSRNINAIGK
jgi:hypothetical protein